MNDDIDIENIKWMLETEKETRDLMKAIQDDQAEFMKKWEASHQEQLKPKSEVVLSKTTRDELIEKFDNGTISKDEFKQLKTYLNTKAKNLVKNSEPESN